MTKEGMSSKEWKYICYLDCRGFTLIKQSGDRFIMETPKKNVEIFEFQEIESIYNALKKREGINERKKGSKKV